jgi:3'-5' exoribonuclease
MAPTNRNDHPTTPPPELKTPVAQLRKGARISGTVYLVQESNFKQTRNSKNFIQLMLRDRTGTIKAVRWEASQELFGSFGAEDFVRISGRVEEFQQQLQIVVDEIVRVPPEAVDQADFLPVSPRDPAEMESELLAAVASVQDAHVKALLLSLLEDPEVRSGILRCPAGKILHHAYIGGLLEHILSLVGAARLIAKNYPALNVDLMIAAAIIHDIGKIRELSYARSFGYTDEGQLVGHLGIGLLLIAEKVRAIPDFPRELHLHLEHIILSHHGLPEHGAVKVPMTAEAIAFHYLDNLDAKLAMVAGLRKDLEIQGEISDRERRWTDYQPALGRRIFFPE